MWFRGFQQLAQIQLAVQQETVQAFQQVGTANQIHQTRHAQLRHQLTRFAGDEFKVVGNFKRQTVIVVLTQFVILSRYTAAQLFRWQIRRYLQPSATIGPVLKSKLSAPRIAA